MRGTSFLVASQLTIGAAGLGLCSTVAQAAPPPANAPANAETDAALVFSASSLVILATADASGVYIYASSDDSGPRALLRRRPDGKVETLATAPRIEQLALDEEQVYWVGADGVQAVAKRGGPVRTLARTGASSRWGLALDGDEVYVSTDSRIARVSKRGGPMQVLAKPGAGTLVGVDASEVWWLERGGPSAYELLAMPKGGGAPRHVLSNLKGVLAMVIDDESIYWLGETEARGRGTIQRASKSTGNKMMLADDVPTYYENALAIDDDNLFWLDYPYVLHGPMRVRTMPKRGGLPTTLAESFPPADKLFVDATHVYWAQYGVHAHPFPAPNADAHRDTARQAAVGSRVDSRGNAIGMVGASSSPQRRGDEMGRARTTLAIGLSAASSLWGHAAAADCTDPSCPKEVAQAMAQSGARLPLVLSVGLRSLSYAPSARDHFDGSVSASPMGYEFSGDALGGSALRTYGAEIGADWAFSPFVYLGVAAAWGEGSWTATPFSAGQMAIEPRATVNSHMWLTGLRAGVRLPLGPVSLRAELLGGAEWISLQQFASSSTSGPMSADASSVTWIVEPRAAVDLWTTPYTVVSAFGAMPGFDSRASNAGVTFAWHWRSFDGRYSGVL